jgi:homocysteine S-methyltransferase
VTDALAAILADAPVAIDGGFATELEARGHDLSDALWSARLLRDDPAAVEAVALAYLRAGARVVITGSYQASREAFARAGVESGEADVLIARSVTLARTARAAFTAEQPAAPPVAVAGSLGPYGAMLAGGQEYTGDYGAITTAALIAFHAPRVEALLNAEPDLLAWETIPHREEVAAIVELQRQAGGPSAWVSFQCRDGGQLADGTPIEEAAQIAAAAPGVVAIGVNCTAPEFVGELLGRLRDTALELALVVYPNDGRVWDAEARTWSMPGHGGFPAQTVRAWVAAGASLVGGCCGVGPDGVRGIAEALRST